MHYAHLQHTAKKCFRCKYGFWSEGVCWWTWVTKRFFFTRCPHDWLFHSCPDPAASYMPGMPAVSSYGPNPSPGWDICKVPLIVFNNAFCIPAQIPLDLLLRILPGGKQGQQEWVVETVTMCLLTLVQGLYHQHTRSVNLSMNVNEIEFHWFYQFQRLPSIPVPRGQLLPHHWGVDSLSHPDSSFHSGYVPLFSVSLNSVHLTI